MKIKDACTYAPKSNIKAGDATADGQYMFFTSSEDESKRYREYQFDGEGIVMGTGGNATLHYYNGKFAVSTDCVVLLPNNKLRCKYLYYYFLANLPILEAGFKGAGLKHTNKDYIGNIELEIPSLERQDNIISVLDRVFDAIRLRNNELYLFNDLVKARFVEMFGDPRENPLEWKIGRLGDYMTTLADFSANGSYELLDSHVIMYDEPNYAIMVRTTDLESGDLQNGVKYIDEAAYELLGKTKLYGGEMIMNKIGSAGKIYIMPHINIPASLGRNAFMFKFDDTIDIVFLYALLTSEYGTAEIQQHVRGAVTKTITKDSTRSIRIIVPPIEKQKQFATFVAQVDKSKVVVLKALDKAQTLFDSLMQQYFG